MFKTAKFNETKMHVSSHLLRCSSSSSLREARLKGPSISVCLSRFGTTMGPEVTVLVIVIKIVILIVIPIVAIPTGIVTVNLIVILIPILIFIPTFIPIVLLIIIVILIPIVILSPTIVFIPETENVLIPKTDFEGWFTETVNMSEWEIIMSFHEQHQMSTYKMSHVSGGIPLSGCFLLFLHF
jgi:hypothetical protein